MIRGSFFHDQTLRCTRQRWRCTTVLNFTAARRGARGCLKFLPAAGKTRGNLALEECAATQQHVRVRTTESMEIDDRVRAEVKLNARFKILAVSVPDKEQLNCAYYYDSL